MYVCMYAPKKIQLKSFFWLYLMYYKINSVPKSFE